MEDQQTIKSEYSELMRKSFIDYAMSVIVARALPDARDGLKPVQRRTLYDMYELGIYSDRPYRKCARIVGDTMGKYHPHGDSSIYEALVGMAQDFKKGQALVDGHGNFGNIEGDVEAAMRYTEARLHPISQEAFLADLDKDVVDFVPNFDETEKEPEVLPVRFPNLLVNGSEGIAVGMATNIPPHNLAEVIDATKAYLQNEQITDRELLRYLKGPDFPTGGIVTNQEDLASIYETGTGKIRIRGRVEVEKGKNGHPLVVVKEIPYPMIGANIGKFLSDVAQLSETKKTADIVDISNQSSKEGVRIVIELRKDADVDRFMNLLYKKTRLEDVFGVNMLAIKNGRPETMSLREIIATSVEFQFACNRRKYETLLKKEKEKKEIQEGLIKACNVIDLIIEILRGSKDRAMAKACLVEGNTQGIQFRAKESSVMAAYLRFTPRQAEAILTMQLYKLIGLEVDALVKEHEETLANIYRYEDLLERKSSMAQVIANDLEEIKRKYARKRRTSIENCREAVYQEEEGEAQDAWCLIDRFGYAKLIDDAAYQRNREAAEGESRFAIPCKTDGRLCLFTDSGQLYTLRAADLPLGKLRDKGVPLDNVSNFESSREHILLAASQSDLNLYRLFFVTRQGMVKAVDGGEFDVSRRTAAATKLSQGDQLVDVAVCRDQTHLVLQSREGYFLRFPVEEIPEKKKTALGSRGMRLGDGDSIEAVYYIKSAVERRVTVKGKELSLNGLRLGKRDGKGVKVRI